MGEHGDMAYSLAADGHFLYLADAEHKCLLKLGSGRAGTVEGKIYARLPGMRFFFLLVGLWSSLFSHLSSPPPTPIPT